MKPEESGGGSAPPGAPAVPTCPRCGSEDVAFDYRGVITFRVVGGRLVYVHIGGVLGVLPDELYCYECDEQEAPSQASGEAGLALIDEALPESLARDLTNGFELWERTSEESR